MKITVRTRSDLRHESVLCPGPSASSPKPTRVALLLIAVLATVLSLAGCMVASPRSIGWMAPRTGRLKVRRAFLNDRISLQPGEHVRHPDGGRRTFARTLGEHTALDRRVAAERDQGSRKHHRLPRWFRWLPRVVLVFDFFLLLYFLSGITDVNWMAPMSPELAFAAGLAAMITVVSYGCFAFAGHRLRMHKDHAGTIPAADLDGLTRIVVGACAGGLT